MNGGESQHCRRSHQMVHIRIVARQQPPKTIKQQWTDSLAHQHTVKLQPSAPPPPLWISTLISSTRRTICRVISLHQQTVTERRRTFGLIKLLNHTNKKQKQHQRGTAALLQSSSLFPKYRIQRTCSPKPLVGIIS